MPNYVDERVYNIARRLHERRKLDFPVDVEGLLQEFAKLKYVDFPFEIDGLCLDLKVPGKRPSVFVKKDVHPKRKRFTLSHELGHILIPWHDGNIVDDVNIEKFTDFRYWHIEQEANAFASELLMPKQFMESVISDFSTLQEMIEEVVDAADVSIPAAFFRLGSALPRNNIIFMSFGRDQEYKCLRSPGTRLYHGPSEIYIDWDEDDIPNGQKVEFALRQYRFIHWSFPNRLAPPAVLSGQSWRELLDEALDRIGLDKIEKSKVKQSLNGVVSHINNTLKQSTDIEEHYAELIHRISPDGRFSCLLGVDAFHEFAVKRFEEFIVNKVAKAVDSA